mgnify:CR=1 FL=1
MSTYLPLVTAIITTYRRQPDIVGRAINSIINQTYKNIEIIVVDDSPPTYERRNDVRRLVESYDKSIIYIQHEKNMGACVARNTGLKMAMGEFVAYLDDDDEWMDTKIEKQLACFTRDDVAVVYCGRVIKEDSTGRIRKTKCIYCEGDIYKEKGCFYPIG